MATRPVQTIDMTLAGDLLPRPAELGLTGKIGVTAAMVAVAAAVLSVAALFLWLLSVLLPVAIISGAIAFAAFRLQLWRLRTQL